MGFDRFPPEGGLPGGTGATTDPAVLAGVGGMARGSHGTLAMQACGQALGDGGASSVAAWVRQAAAARGQMDGCSTQEPTSMADAPTMRSEGERARAERESRRMEEHSTRQ